jgi:HEAT repeat protein
MSYYDLSKEERLNLDFKIKNAIISDINNNRIANTLSYFSDNDTYVRKSAYLAFRDIYLNKKISVESLIIYLEQFKNNANELVRQATVNAFGEIGKYEPDLVIKNIEDFLTDEHHKVRNAVIGTLKKVGEKQPKQVLDLANKHLDNPDPEIRRQVLHGIELYGRTHPKEVLPLLKHLQYEKIARVRNMVIHIVGQIAYKKGCLEIVLEDLKTWKNKFLVEKILLEIIEVHGRYEDFSEFKQNEVIQFISNSFGIKISSLV